jgi:hypothetical protein
MRVFAQIGPSTWRFVDDSPPPTRSDLPFPNIISDYMDPVEQVDGKFYDSKAAFRAVGRALGLTEVGTEKIKPRKYRDLAAPEIRRARREMLGKAVARYRNGERHALGQR